MNARLPAALSLGLLMLLAACQRLNPDYCDEEIRCSEGRICGPLRSCVEPPPADLAETAPDLARAVDAATPRDLASAPDLSPRCGNVDCTCYTGAPAGGCSCMPPMSCMLTCGDSCPKDLVCTSSSSCSLTCGRGCKAVCRDGTCTVVVGSASEVVCDKSTCTVTCQGTCTVKNERMTATIFVTCPVGQPRMSCMGGVTACGPCP